MITTRARAMSKRSGPSPVPLDNARLCLLLAGDDGNALLIIPLSAGTRDTAPAHVIESRAHVLDDHVPSPSNSPPATNEPLLPLVEDALKRLWDFSYLGNHPLTRLKIVRDRCKPTREPLTCLHRAAAVSALLTEMIELLRPGGPIPARTAIPRREWHSYMILRFAYLEGDHNYTIMNWLQIGEGTFNRTRRRALLAVAKALAELEEQAQCNS